MEYLSGTLNGVKCRGVHTVISTLYYFVHANFSMRRCDFVRIQNLHFCVWVRLCASVRFALPWGFGPDRPGFLSLWRTQQSFLLQTTEGRGASGNNDYHLGIVRTPPWTHSWGGWQVQEQWSRDLGTRKDPGALQAGRAEKGPFLPGKERKDVGFLYLLFYSYFNHVLLVEAPWVFTLLAGVASSKIESLPNCI